MNKYFKIIQISQPFLLFCTIVGILNYWYIFIILISSMFFLSKKEKALTLTLVMPPIFGMIVPLFFPIPGTLLSLLLALLILRGELISLIRNINKNVWSYISLLLFVFLCFYLMSDMGKYAQTKFIEIFITTTLGVLNFGILTQDKNINASKISLLFGLGAVFCMASGYGIFGYNLPNGPFDFESFRSSTMDLVHLDLPSISYHMPALFTVSATAYLLCNKKRLNYIDYILIPTYFWLNLLCGARQGIVSFIIIIFFWYLIKDDKIKIRNILAAFFVLLISYIILVSLDIELIQKMFDSKSSINENFNRNIDYPISIILSYPITGIGFGNYMNPYTGEWYPHNMLFELIIEFGFFGFLILAFLVFTFCVNNRINLRTTLPNGGYCAIILLPFFLRAMISDHIGSNIIVFIAFFILFRNKIDNTKRFNTI